LGLGRFGFFIGQCLGSENFSLGIFVYGFLGLGCRDSDSGLPDLSSFNLPMSLRTRKALIRRRTLTPAKSFGVYGLGGTTRHLQNRSGFCLQFREVRQITGQLTENWTTDGELDN